MVRRKICVRIIPRHRVLTNKATASTKAKSAKPAAAAKVKNWRSGEGPAGCTTDGWAIDGWDPDGRGLLATVAPQDCGWISHAS
jgi:hypothetical protein